MDVRVKTAAFAAFLWVLLGFSPWLGAASYDVESEVALERSLETRLQAVLRKALDTEDLLVIVNLDVAAADAEQKNPGDIMPGVPIKQNPATPSALGLPAAL